MTPEEADSVRTLASPGPVGLASPPRSSGLVRAAQKVLEIAVFGVAPVVLVVAFIAVAVGDQYAFDFRQFWQGGRDVLEGVDPYPATGSLPNDPSARDLTPEEIQSTYRFPYPAVTAVLLAPLAVLPFGLAAAVLTVLLLGAVGLSLRLLEVRDWRCYGAAYGSILTLGSVRLGTFTPLLLLAVAAAWRFRARTRAAAGALAIGIVLKLFLLPLVGWLLVVGRVRTAAITVVAAVPLLVAGWAVIGFDGMTAYPDLLSSLSDAVQGQGYSLVALGLDAGLSERAAAVLAAAAGAALLALAWAVARRGGSEVLVLTVALVACLALSPIVWLHYFLLLLVPIAILRPRLSPLWAVPLLFWLTPFQETEGAAWRMVLAAGLTVVVVVAAARPSVQPAAVRRT